MEFRDDDYLSCSEYAGHGRGEDGFARFTHDNGQYYFSLLDEDDSVILRSEGYSSEAARDNGLASVKKNMTDESKYSTKMYPNGKWVLSLKAANHQEIARSCPADDEAGAKAMLPSERKKAAEAKAAAAAAASAAASAGGSTKSTTDQDDYLICREYRERVADSKSDKYPGFITFTHDNGEHYFAMINDKDEVVFRSEGYTSESARDNGVESVIRNKGIEKRYGMEERMGVYFVTLKAGNHQEIARSCPMRSKEAATGMMSFSIGEPISTDTPAEETVEVAAPAAAAVAATSVAATATDASSEADEAPPELEDDYLPCREYEGHTVNDKQNNIAFFKHDNGQFYFVQYDDNGKVVLRSEGFRTSQERDKEVSGVIKHGNDESMYTVHTYGSYTIRILKDKTGREVGRSCLEKKAAAPAPVVEPVKVATPTAEVKVEETKVEVEAIAPKVEVATSAATPAVEKVEDVKETPAVEVAAAATTVVAAAASASTGSSDVEPEPEIEDDYLPCGAYKGHKINDTKNNIAFFKHENGQYYFVKYDADGNVVLRSEGFSTSQDRDKELSGVIKFHDNEDMYEVRKYGSYTIRILKDNTGREVGRSCLEKAEAKPAAPAPVAVAAAVAAATVVEEEPVPEIEDDYIPCGVYKGHKVTDAEHNIAFFEHEGQHYFVVYDNDGNVRLRSEGFQSTKERDSELAAVRKHKDNEDMYTVRRYGRYVLRILKDDNGREVGRSCLEKEEIAPVVIDTPVEETPKVEVKTVVAAAATAIAASEVVKPKAEIKVEAPKKEIKVDIPKVEVEAPKKEIKVEVPKKEIKVEAPKKKEIVVETPKKKEIVVEKITPAPVTPPPPPKVVVETVKEVDVEDDYLTCKEYQGHKVNDKKNNIAFFKHKNGQYYFVAYDKDGDVRLRSEGFKNAKSRDKELSGVIRYMNNEDMYTVREYGDKVLRILKDDKGKEVGRSCLEAKSKRSAVAGAAAVAATAIAAEVVKPKAEIKVEAPKKKVKVETPKVAPKVVKTERTVKAAAPVVEEVVESGGFNWLWLLLPLLALLGFMFWKGCFGCNKPEVKVPEAKVVAPPVETEKAAPVPEPEPAPAPVTCNCSGATDRIFKPCSGNAKSLTRLGTNPQFGSLHGMSGAQVLDKFRNSSAADKAFLNRVFKGMGYAGLADANASMFSETTVPSGTVGRMGAGANRITCATLNTTGRDTQAFRIKAANGCDVHFMKTCGNYFYYCTK